MRVYAQQITEKLSVERATLRRWAKAGLLVGDKGAYELQDVDRFLGACARHFGESPATWLALQNAPSLIGAGEAQKTFGLTRMQLKGLVKRYSLPHLQLPGRSTSRSMTTSRFVREPIARLMASIKPSVSLAFAMRATGYADRNWFKALPEIEIVHNPLRTDPSLYVSRESLVAYLLPRLSATISVEDWLDDCEATEEPLKTPEETTLLLGFSQHTSPFFLQELQYRGGHYVLKRSSSGSMAPRVSPLWVRAQLETAQPFTVHDVARLFDVDRSAVTRWQRKGSLVCHIEGHKHSKDDPFLWQACWLAYLKQHCTPGLESHMQHFMMQRLCLDPPPALLTSTDIEQQYGKGWPTIKRYTDKGRLPSIVIPSGTRRFTEEWVLWSGLRPRT